MQQIKIAKRHFHHLFDIVVFVANINSKSKSAISTQKKFVESILSSIENIQSSKRDVKLSQKIVKFKNDKTRFNMHTTFHYEISMQKYEMSNNVNVLINENKHK